MRSKSEIIFRAEEMSRRSLATGCCFSSSLRHRDSISRSILSIPASTSNTRAASSSLPSVTACTARLTAVSHWAPISVMF